MSERHYGWLEKHSWRRTARIFERCLHMRGAEAMSRMINDAKRLDVDAVVNVRFTTSQTIGRSHRVAGLWDRSETEKIMR